MSETFQRGNTVQIFTSALFFGLPMQNFSNTPRQVPVNRHIKHNGKSGQWFQDVCIWAIYKYQLHFSKVVVEGWGLFGGFFWHHMHQNFILQWLYLLASVKTSKSHIIML